MKSQPSPEAPGPVETPVPARRSKVKPRRPRKGAGLRLRRVSPLLVLAVLGLAPWYLPPGFGGWSTELLWELAPESHRGSVTAVALDGPLAGDVRIGSAAADGSVFLWSTDQARLGRVLSLETNESPEAKAVVRALAFSADGAWLAAGDDRERVRLWKMPERPGSMPAEVPFDAGELSLAPTVAGRGLDGPSEVTGLAFAEDPQFLVAGTTRGQLFRIELEDLGVRRIASSACSAGRITAVAPVPRPSETVLAGDDDGKIWSWQPGDGDPTEIAQMEGAVRALHFRPGWLRRGDTSRLAAVTAGLLSVFDLDPAQDPTGAAALARPAWSAATPGESFSDVEFGSDGLVWTVDRRGATYGWEIESGRLKIQGSWAGMTSSASELALSQESNRLTPVPPTAASGGPGATVRVQSGNETAVLLGGEPQLLAANSEGTSFAVTYGAGLVGSSLVRFFAGSPRLPIRVPEPSLTCLAYSSDGAWLLGKDKSGTQRHWRLTPPTRPTSDANSLVPPMAPPPCPPPARSRKRFEILTLEQVHSRETYLQDHRTGLLIFAGDTFRRVAPLRRSLRDHLLGRFPFAAFNDTGAVQVARIQPSIPTLGVGVFLALLILGRALVATRYFRRRQD